MNEYTEYLKYKKLGLREKANSYARLVVEVWEKTKDKEFAFEIAKYADEQRLNQILFNGIVFPIIKDGLEGDPECIKCGISCIQNIYSDQKLHKSLGYISEAQLCSRLIKLTPNDKWAKEKYIAVNMNWLAHCVHAWPSGILYGMNGADPEQCNEIIIEINRLRGLVNEESDREYLSDVEGKVKEYMKRKCS